jgi:hypothetical protein
VANDFLQNFARTLFVSPRFTTTVTTRLPRLGWTNVTVCVPALTLTPILGVRPSGLPSTTTLDGGVEFRLSSAPCAAAGAVVLVSVLGGGGATGTVLPVGISDAGGGDGWGAAARAESAGAVDSGAALVASTASALDGAADGDGDAVAEDPPRRRRAPTTIVARTARPATRSAIRRIDAGIGARAGLSSIGPGSLAVGLDVSKA